MLFSLTTYFNFRLSEEVKNNADFISKSSTIMRNSTRFQRNVLNMQSGLRGYLLSGEIYFIQVFDSAAVENESILKELSGLIPPGSVQHQALKKIIDLNEQWINNYAYPLRQAKMESLHSKSNLAAFDKLYRDKIIAGNEKEINSNLQEKFKDFSNYEYSSREKKIAELTVSLRRTRIISFTLTTLSLIVGFLISGLLAYSISNRIMKMVKMADSIAAGNYKVHMQDAGSDELSRLAKALNHMANVLSENISLLKRKNEELDQFAHVVSHDLKGPLRGIDNVITWIEEDHSEEITPKVNEYLQTIKGRVRRGENLIQGILSYARTGREVALKEHVDLNMLLQEVLETLAIKPGLTVEVQPRFPAFYTDKYPLFQVFSNLINNAVKYHDKADGVVKIYYKEYNSYYEFFVEDNGPGIAPHYHNKIFVIFQTLQDRDSFESTGVGLAIVKKILDARKERINISSQPGKGCIFSFTWSK